MKLTHRSWGIVRIIGTILSNLFAWQSQSICWLSLAFIIDRRVVLAYKWKRSNSTSLTIFRLYPAHIHMARENALTDYVVKGLCYFFIIEALFAWDIKLFSNLTFEEKRYLTSTIISIHLIILMLVLHSYSFRLWLW